jgi:hypothetical protein
MQVGQIYITPSLTFNWGIFTIRLLSHATGAYLQYTFSHMQLGHIYITPPLIQLGHIYNTPSLTCNWGIFTLRLLSYNLGIFTLTQEGKFISPAVPLYK